MREFKGHNGPCVGGCGCKLDGINMLKRVRFLTKADALRCMLGNPSQLQLLHSKH